jgi:COMPASS component SWD1
MSSAAGCENGEVVIWDFETRVVARTFKPHNQAVTCLAWGRSGHHLHSGSSDGEVSVWDILNNAEVLCSSAFAPSHA